MEATEVCPKGTGMWRSGHPRWNHGKGKPWFLSSRPPTPPLTLELLLAENKSGRVSLVHSSWRWGRGWWIYPEINRAGHTQSTREISRKAECEGKTDLATEAAWLPGHAPTFCHQRGTQKWRLERGACVHAGWLQSCPTLCDTMDCSPPGHSGLIPGARHNGWTARIQWSLTSPAEFHQQPTGPR